MILTSGCKPQSNATSGSSGHPGFFLFDEPEWLWVLASFARSQEWSGARLDLTRRQRMAQPRFAMPATQFTTIFRALTPSRKLGSQRSEAGFLPAEPL